MLLPLLLSSVLAGEDVVPPATTIRMQEAALVVGSRAELVLELDGGAPGWWKPPADVSAVRPILHLDVPDCVRLLGDPPAPLVTPHDYETNFLRFPHGRKLHAPSTTIAFELVAEPEPGDRIGLELVFWLENDDPERATFRRQRLELALEPGAVGTPGDPLKTSWGPHDPLRVGEEMPGFELTTLDGVPLSLEEYAGEPFLIFTYRAFW